MEAYKNDRFQPIWLYSAVDMITNKVIHGPIINSESLSIQYFFLLRVRCVECGGNEYPVEDYSASNLEMHLMDEVHRRNAKDWQEFSGACGDGGINRLESIGAQVRRGLGRGALR